MTPAIAAEIQQFLLHSARSMATIRTLYRPRLSLFFRDKPRRGDRNSGPVDALDRADGHGARDAAVIYCRP